ncbi:hypothetical protein BG011_007364 [Mortierella polycephala]|uniref:P-loop containing nucleoside triphosphate hydrolase protein n=1 Tax=Mortierella polycephala TaxID=41804 RepID=A0A9P6TXT7_9FUNG|nr:hypothetical protein BG011_007364 [Mortierella polycephala]
MILNKNEHRYEVKSSDYLFLYYLVSLLGCALSLFILYDSDPSDPLKSISHQELGHDHQLTTQQQPLDPAPVSRYKMDPFRYLLFFTGFIAFAFFFEAFPRTNTRVQRESRKQEGLTPRDQANLFSRLTFHYVQPLMSQGAKRDLTPADVDTKTPDKLRTRVNDEIVSQTWKKRLTKFNRRYRGGKRPASAIVETEGPSLLLTVLDAYKWQIAPTMVIRLLSFALMYVPLFLFSFLLNFFVEYDEALKKGAPPPPMAKGLLIAVGIFIGNVFSAQLLSMSSLECSNMAIQARAALIAMIYRKALKLSPAARNKSTLGEISNHMAVDAEYWMAASNFLPLTLTIPLEISIALVLLYRLLGWSLLAGLTMFMIIAPIQSMLASYFHSFQKNKLSAMDSRLRLMTEILSNIRVVKLEDAFRRKVDIIRNIEMNAQKALATVRALLMIVISSVNLLIVLATFTVYSNWGGPDFTPAKMTPEVVFVSISLFTMLGRTSAFVSLAVSHLIALRTANGRIQKFLLEEEIETSSVQRFSRQDSSKDSVRDADGKILAIEIQDGTFAWEQQPRLGQSKEPAAPEMTDEQGERQPLLGIDDSSSSTIPPPVRPVLSNINLQVPEGSLTAIVGRIGQGKSSLLSAIIGEMYKYQGMVSVYGNIAYVPQQAWIVNATMKDNILFGKLFDQEKYDRITFASGLTQDIEMLPAGDMTEIGERGINLSGGQKQRVSLARAAYQDADIYLLDDPLSAVDAHVDQHLWQNLIGPDGLLKGKARILVTHGIHHLENMDQIVVVKDGMILETGEYRSLMKAQSAFCQLITEYSVQERKKQEQEQQQSISHTETDSAATEMDTEDLIQETRNEMDGSGQGSINNGAMALSANQKPNGGLISAEKTQIGRVRRGVYLDYAKAISFHNAIICLFLYALSQACQISTNFWLRYWIKADDRDDDRSTMFFIGGYALLITMYLVVDVTVNYMANVVCGIQGAKSLHERLLTRVLRMPMSFFDTTPMGRIINIFSSDMSAVDSQLPEYLPGLLGFISTGCGILIVIGYSIPMSLLAVPPLGLAFFLIQDYFIKTSGALKRLLSVSKSPLYQHFSETLAGVSTIRSMTGQTARFMEENDKRSDLIAQRTDVLLVATRWLVIRIQTLAALIIFLAASLAVFNVERLDPSLVGLALSYALALSNVASILVRSASDVQNQFVSVERIQEYIHKPLEAPLETGVQIPEEWPKLGKVVFNHFSARYRDGLNLCIKDVSFIVQPTEKIAIVGRTGSGKSSLALALFRIIEAADSFWALASDPLAMDQPIDSDAFAGALHGGDGGGSIEIDGDPTLFSGTVRENLDPFEEHSDLDLWVALERAHLKTHISSLTGGLMFEVTQNGENFSVGQRSLICLARALLRKSKVLILDEATAAVDVETDTLIQKTIRTEFKDRTILTIAHRIKTVMDSDKILVLDQGRVQEYEAPGALLRKPDSMFYSLARQAGEI